MTETRPDSNESSDRRRETRHPLSPMDDRGVSTVVGTVLLVAVVAVALAALGANFILGSSQGEDLDTQQIERDLRQLQTETQDVTDGTVDRTTIEFGLQQGADRSYAIEESAGRITVEIGGSVVYQSPLGRIMMDEGDGLNAYQAGGVFGKTNLSSYPVSNPQFSREDRPAPTYNMPVVVVSGTGAANSEMDVSRVDSAVVYQDREVAGGDTVEIIIQSEFASAWGQVLAQEFQLDSSQLTVDTDNNKVLAEISHSNAYYFLLTEHQIEVNPS